MASSRSQAGDWRSVHIPSGQDTFAAADLFQHSKRDSGFPLMYRLHGQHPLRPSTFTAGNYPRVGRDRFYDYVVMIRKEADFMKQWQEIGDEQDTPNDNIASNRRMGMFSPFSP